MGAFVLLTQGRTFLSLIFLIVPNVELSPICSSAFRPGPPSEQAQVTSDAIDRVLKESKVLDLKDLCIEEGKAVWSLWIDVVCVSYDGNIYDAALASVMAALANGTNCFQESSLVPPLPSFVFHQS